MKRALLITLAVIVALGAAHWLKIIQLPFLPTGVEQARGPQTGFGFGGRRAANRAEVVPVLTAITAAADCKYVAVSRRLALPARFIKFWS